MPPLLSYTLEQTSRSIQFAAPERIAREGAAPGCVTRAVACGSNRELCGIEGVDQYRRAIFRTPRYRARARTVPGICNVAEATPPGLRQLWHFASAEYWTDRFSKRGGCLRRNHHGREGAEHEDGKLGHISVHWCTEATAGKSAASFTGRFAGPLNRDILPERNMAVANLAEVINAPDGMRGAGVRICLLL